MAQSNWLSRKLDKMISNANEKEHSKAKQKIVDAFLNGNQRQAKDLYDQECIRYAESLEMSNYTRSEISEKINEFYLFFMMAGVNICKH